VAARACGPAPHATTETFEPTLDERGVLSLECTAGTYSLEATEGRILLFSPISGPKYYEWDAENAWWYHAADGHQLVELLVREIMHTTGACVNL
jgi:frataxin-like iron-binding protein CyaY